MELSRDLAICMFFYVEYTKDIIKECKEPMKVLENVEICYNIDPKQPILVSKESIRRDLQSYHLYPVMLD
jgi:hypothetical protein